MDPAPASLRGSVTRVVFTPEQLGARLRADKDKLPDELKRALKASAQRGRSYIVAESPVDRGILRNAWKVVEQIDGALLQNDQPYAGIIERGARPFKLTPKGREALAGWVFRKLLSGTIAVNQHKRADLKAEADRIAWAIAKKFEAVGMKGSEFVKKALPILAAMMDEEIVEYLQRFFQRNGN